MLASRICNESRYLLIGKCMKRRNLRIASLLNIYLIFLIPARQPYMHLLVNYFCQLPGDIFLNLMLKACSLARGCMYTQIAMWLMI